MEPLESRFQPSGLTDPTGLLLFTDGKVDKSGTPGLQSWTARTVLNVSGPNFALEPGVTAGQFSELFDLTDFTPKDVKVDALHYVRTAVTVGQGAAAFTLRPGDVLLSVDQNGIPLASLNALTVDRDDVFVFRPAAAGNYAAGTFFPLLAGLSAVIGGKDVNGVSLVERTTVVGDTTLPTGSFLLIRDGTDKDVQLFTPTGVGVGQTAGAVATLIAGADLGIGAKLNGVDLVETATTVGGRPLAAGTLLIATDDSKVGVGASVLAVDKHDIVALSVTQTTLGSGKAVATPSLLFEGGDVGLDAGAEVIRGFSLTALAAPPTAGDDTYSTNEDTPLLVGPGGVLGNDTPGATAALLAGPAHGSVTLAANGAFAYTPAADYFGPDAFTYTATTAGGTATATVTITVAPVNDRPTFSTAGNPPAVNEDAGPQAVPGFVADASAGPNETQTLTFRVVGNTNPALFAASPAIAPDGTLTYTPAADANGTATITVVLQDDGGTANGGQDTGAPRTFTVTVRPVNDPPTLDPLPNLTIAEDAGPQAVALTGVTAGGGEVQPLRVTAVSSNPALIPNPAVVYAGPAATGSLTFAPNPNATGTATITVVVRDAGANNFLGDADDAVATRTFVVTVTPVADPPTAVADTYSTASGLLLQVLGAGVLANDSDPDGDPLTAAVVTPPANGLVVLLPTGGFTYTPAVGFSGVDAFTYRAADPAGNTATATVTLNVGLGNRPPVAAADAFTTAEDTAVAGNVLANDADPDGDPLTAAVLVGTANGGLAFNANGGFVYTPNPDFYGVDSFTYTVSDGAGGTATGTVTITVTSVNDPPAAADDAATVAEDGAVTIAVRANDADQEGDPLTIVAVTQGANGVVTTDGLTVAYTPAADFNGTDTFTYTIADGNGGFATATVTVVVTPVNDPPTLDPLAAVTILEDAGTQVVRLTGVTAGGGESQPLTVTATSDNPQLIGSLAAVLTNGGPTGWLTFAPRPDANGTATVTVTVSDGVATVSRSFVVVVTPVNDAPTVTPIANQTVNEGETVGPLTFTVGDVETPAAALTVTATSGNGGLIPDANITITTVGGQRQITLVPAANASGASVIVVTVSDGAATATTTFVVRVRHVNHPPAAAADAFTTTRGATLTEPVGVLANDADPDGDPLAAELLQPTLHGTVRLNADGTFAYAPAAGFQGTDTFTYRAVDTAGARSAPATVTITVDPAPPPTAAADAYTVTSGLLRVRAAAGVLANDLASRGDPLRADLAAGPAHGTLFLAAAGGFVYAADAGYVGPDTFAYQAVDPFGGASVPVTVTLQVRGTAADHFTVPQDQALVAAGPAGFAAGDGSDGVTVDLQAPPAHGDVVMSQDGSFTYQPAAGFVGVDTFRYKLTDGTREAVRTVTITVEPAAEPPVVNPPPPVVPPPPPVPPTSPLSPPPPLPLAPAVEAAAEVAITPAAEVVSTPAAPPAAEARPTPPPVRDAVPAYVIALTNVAPKAVPGAEAKPAPDRTAAAADAKPTPVEPPVVAAPDVKPAPPVAVAPPSPPPVAATVAPPVAVAPPAPDALVVADVVAPGLNQVANELRADTDDRAAADAIVTTTVAASAGFVLLNTRAVYWLISALLVRPAVWRRFDPIDVIYAWENEQDRDPAADPAGGGESLQSIVG